MLTYLAITALLNIALGYALAVYLGHATARPAHVLPKSTAPSEPAAPVEATPVAPVQGGIRAQTTVKADAEPDQYPTTPGNFEAPEPEPGDGLAAAPLAETQPMISSLDSVEASAGAHAEEPPVEAEGPSAAAEAPSAEVEQELLAGIEEFRNQLAQLKSKHGGLPPAELLAGVHAE